MKNEIVALGATAKKALQTATSADELRAFAVAYLGRKGKVSALSQGLGSLPVAERKVIGPFVAALREELQSAVSSKESALSASTSGVVFDTTLPGIRPSEGHLHIVSQAIAEIEDIFARIGFSRVRHPEVDTDWYAFEALNMPPDHPARDDWETFFVTGPKFSSASTENFVGSNNPPSIAPAGTEARRAEALVRSRGGSVDAGLLQLVLTPHTSNGQVREMQKGKLPIRMINIGKCYRRQADVSHVPMFHQFEGLVVDTDVNITHLKGVIEYFVHQFFGTHRFHRLRPFHFRFTEPSFEIDITCDVCDGSGCRLCKEGWLELGGAGMVHPNVLKAGNIDPKKYSGFAFGWGVERTSMMKEGLKIDDIRLLYKNDLRFLEQF